MAKSFLCRRSPAAMTVMSDAMDDICQDVHRAEKLYGRESLETAEPLLMLASLYYVVEDYEKAERVFVRYAETVKVKLGPNTLEVFHSLGILAEIYFLPQPVARGFWPH